MSAAVTTHSYGSVVVEHLRAHGVPLDAAEASDLRMMHSAAAVIRRLEGRSETREITYRAFQAESLAAGKAAWAPSSEPAVKAAPVVRTLTVVPAEPVESPQDREALDRDAVRGSAFGRRLAAATFDRDGLRDLPAPEPLIADLVDRRSLVLLFGTYGTCKSFVALDWSCCAATGAPWQGRAVEPVRVLYIAGEGVYGLNQRVSAWESSRSTSVAADRLTFVSLAVQLATPHEMDALALMVEEGGYGLIVIDTLARSAIGKDENAAKDAGELVAGMDRLKDAAEAVGGTVLVVAHTGKDGKTMRGSSAFEGAMDAAFQMTGSTSALRFTTTKQKDRVMGDAIALRLADVPGTTSAAIAGVDAGEPEEKRATDPSHLALLRAFGAGRSFTTASALTVLTDEERGEEKVSRASGHRHLKELEDRGLLTSEEEGRARRYTLPASESDLPFDV